MSPSFHKCGLFCFFLIIRELSCKGPSLPPSPVNVSFSSLNLRNVLQWNPGDGTPDGTRYTVQFAFYGDSVEGSKGKRVNWRPVPRCKETARTWCDLSRETWDLQQEYYGRVRAVGSALSKWVVTHRRFNPKSDTTFGQPQISVEVKDNNAIIYLTGPIRYQPDDHAPPISMATIYPQMTYNLSVYNMRQEQVHHFPVTFSPYKYRLMDYDTEYCFSAKTRLLSLHFHCHQSERHCITTSKDPVTGQVRMVVVGIVVPSLCICILLVVGYVLYHYLMGNGQKRPNTLDLFLIRHQTMPLPHDPITPLKSGRSSDDEDNGASDCGPSNAIWHPQPEPREPCDYLPSYGVVGVATTEGGEQGDAHPEELRVKNASQPASQCYLPQAQSRQPLENVAQTQADFPTCYLANTPPNVPVTKGKEVTGSPYQMRREDIQSTPPPFACHAGSSKLTADNYGVLVPTVAEQDEEAGPLCIDWDPQMRQLVLPGLETTSRGEGEGGGEKVANGDLRVEKVFVRQASREEAGPRPAGAAGWEVDEIAKKWNLVISSE